MELKRFSERIWFLPYEKERDRPILGYVRGDRWSLAVDAGHSAAHTEEFYRALEGAGLPLPALTVLTHWHWDHTFGMHALHGLSLSSRLTGGHLRAFAEKIRREGTEFFLNMDPSIRLEYAGGREVRVVPADMEYAGEIYLDAGNCPVRVFQTVSPHTDDSSLIEVIPDRTLFVGDAAGGVFPTWEKDPAKCRALADVIRQTDADWCLESHWEPQATYELLESLESD